MVVVVVVVWEMDLCSEGGRMEYVGVNMFCGREQNRTMKWCSRLYFLSVMTVFLTGAKKGDTTLGPSDIVC